MASDDTALCFEWKRTTQFHGLPFFVGEIDFLHHSSTTSTRSGFSSHTLDGHDYG